jgi:hypothetical protein
MYLHARETFRARTASRRMRQARREPFCSVVYHTRSPRAQNEDVTDAMRASAAKVVTDAKVALTVEIEMVA